MLRYRITNMTCGGCVKGVTATLREVDPTAQIDIALDRKEAAITPATADAARIEQALREAGWEAERLAA